MFNSGGLDLGLVSSGLGLGLVTLVLIGLGLNNLFLFTSLTFNLFTCMQRR